MKPKRDLQIITILENSRMRLNDISSALNLNNIETAKAVNELVAKNYIIKESVQTSEFFLEDYYYVNKDNIAEIEADVMDLDKEEKLTYIISETNKAANIIFDNMDKEDVKNKMHLSTITLNDDELKVLDSKIKDITDFLENCNESDESKKYSFIMFFAEREDLNQFNPKLN